MKTPYDPGPHHSRYRTPPRNICEFCLNPVALGPRWFPTTERGLMVRPICKRCHWHLCNDDDNGEDTYKAR